MGKGGVYLDVRISQVCRVYLVIGDVIYSGVLSRGREHRRRRKKPCFVPERLSQGWVHPVSQSHPPFFTCRYGSLVRMVMLCGRRIEDRSETESELIGPFKGVPSSGPTRCAVIPIHPWWVPLCNLCLAVAAL